MLKKIAIGIKNMFIFIFLLIVSCLKLLLNSVFAVIRIKDAITDGSYWFAVLYQPFLLLLLMVLFVDKIDKIIYSIMIGQADFLYIILLSFILIALTIYAAIDAKNAKEINTMLLAFGILIFVCIAITDLYKALFISQNVVKDICIQFEDQYNSYKQ